MSEPLGQSGGGEAVRKRGEPSTFVGPDLLDPRAGFSRLRGPGNNDEPGRTESIGQCVLIGRKRREGLFQRRGGFRTYSRSAPRRDQGDGPNRISEFFVLGLRQIECMANGPVSGVAQTIGRLNFEHPTDEGYPQDIEMNMILRRVPVPPPGPGDGFTGNAECPENGVDRATPFDGRQPQALRSRQGDVQDRFGMRTAFCQALHKTLSLRGRQGSDRSADRLGRRLLTSRVTVGIQEEGVPFDIRPHSSSVRERKASRRTSRVWEISMS